MDCTIPNGKTLPDMGICSHITTFSCPLWRQWADQPRKMRNISIYSSVRGTPHWGIIAREFEYPATDWCARMTKSYFENLHGPLDLLIRLSLSQVSSFVCLIRPSLYFICFLHCLYCCCSVIVFEEGLNISYKSSGKDVSFQSPTPTELLQDLKMLVLSSWLQDL